MFIKFKLEVANCPWNVENSFYSIVYDLFTLGLNSPELFGLIWYMICGNLRKTAIFWRQNSPRVPKVGKKHLFWNFIEETNQGSASNLLEMWYVNIFELLVYFGEGFW